MMTHLTEDEVLDAARGQRGTAGSGTHLADCQACQRRVTGLGTIAAAGRTVAAESMAGVPVPPFDRLVAALPSAEPATVQPAARWREHVRLAAALIRAQLRLLPAAVGPISVLGFAAAVLLAVTLPPGEGGGLSTQVFGAVVALVVLIGALSTYSRKRDPRAEPLFTLPVSPPTVFLCRLVGVLGVELLLALACSVTVLLLGGSDSLAVTLASWFGQALLAAGVGLVFAVGREPALGGLLGGLVWALGSVSTLPGSDRMPLHSIFTTLWSSSPVVIALALVLVAAAVLRMRTPRLSGAQVA